jgi:hypothetical protein
MAFLQFLRFLNPKYLIAGVIFAALAYAFYIATDRIILQQEIKNFKATEAQNHERKKTDETIKKLSDDELCGLLGGGLSDQGVCE